MSSWKLKGFVNLLRNLDLGFIGRIFKQSSWLQEEETSSNLSKMNKEINFKFKLTGDLLEEDHGSPLGGR
jgi:hypothetical protein